MNGMNIWRGLLVNACLCSMISHMHVCTTWMSISWRVSNSGIDRHRQSAKLLCIQPLSPDLLQSSLWEFRNPFPSISLAVYPLYVMNGTCKGFLPDLNSYIPPVRICRTDTSTSHSEIIESEFIPIRLLRQWSPVMRYGLAVAARMKHQLICILQSSTKLMKEMIRTKEHTLYINKLNRKVRSFERNCTLTWLAFLVYYVCQGTVSFRKSWMLILGAQNDRDYSMKYLVSW